MRVKCERPQEKVGGAICCHFKQLLFRCTHTHTHQRHRRSRWHGFIKHGKFAKRHTNIIRRRTRLYIQTHFIRMDFVTAGKRLLHFHVPSDIIFRALHYFALIKCGRWKRSNGCFCSVWRPVSQNCHTNTSTRTHTHLKVF